MGRKLKTKRGKKIYARRKAIVEPVFGQIRIRQGKHVLLRGFEKASNEWKLLAAAHNLMKLHNPHHPANKQSQATGPKHHQLQKFNALAGPQQFKNHRTLCRPSNHYWPTHLAKPLADSRQSA
ncbi:hypothetical protein QO003_003825 [Arthrobacter silviterrae]|nr:hypothetical protein [Arthrobacter silviterrae]